MLKKAFDGEVYYWYEDGKPYPKPKRKEPEHYGECPWCRAHPHREACSSSCARARSDKAELDLARVQMEASNQHHE